MPDIHNMNEPATSRLYDLWAKFYDNTFGALVHKRQIAALDQLRPQPGDVILDLGIGTGMTLGHYPDNVHVVGMDLSPGMLRKAENKRKAAGQDHATLVLGDGMHPPFAEHSFDHVIISHTVSVVSEPNRLMQWAARLVKPTGTVIVLNHFQSSNKLVGGFEHVFNPMFVKIGWRSNLSLEEALQDVDLHLHYRFKLATVDLWQIVVLSPQPLGPQARAQPVGPGRPLKPTLAS